MTDHAGEIEDGDGPTTPSWMMDRCNLFGQVGMIVCWYWDGSDGESNGEYAVRGVKLIRRLLRGRTEEFSRADWWTFMDALGSYPHRDAMLEELYQLALAGHAGTLPPGRTKRFDIPED